MKKLVALLLVALMSVSMVACGETNTSAEENNASTISTEETSTTETSAIENSTTESQAEELSAIEITLDNWQDYFEINQYLNVYYSTDNLGEVTDSTYSVVTIFELKEEYYIYCPIGITLEYDADYCVSDVIYNLDDFSFELVDCVSHPDTTIDESKFIRGEQAQISIAYATGYYQHKLVDGDVVKDSVEYSNDGWYDDGVWCVDDGTLFGVNIDSSKISDNEDGTGYIEQCPTNIQITRIEGTLSPR